MAISRKERFSKEEKLREVLMRKPKRKKLSNDGRYSYRYTDVRTGKRLTVMHKIYQSFEKKRSRLQKIWKIIY